MVRDRAVYVAFGLDAKACLSVGDTIMGNGRILLAGRLHRAGDLMEVP